MYTNTDLNIYRHMHTYIYTYAHHPAKISQVPIFERTHQTPQSTLTFI